MAIEVLVIILIVAFAVITATLVFTGWVFFAVIRGGFRSLFGRWEAPQLPPALATRCGREKCGAPNLTNAQFCRRCGNRLHVSRQSFARAAMW